MNCDFIKHTLYSGMHIFTLQG